MKALGYGLIGLFCAAVLVACGDSNTTPVAGGDPLFPEVDQGLLDANCIRGTAPLPAVRPGEITEADCSTVGTLIGSPLEGLYEGWRVRVEEPTNASFSVNAQYNSFLDLFQVDLASGTVTLLAFDDDSGGNGQPLFNFDLVPNLEYWVMVSGVTEAATGPYTLTIN